MIRSMSGCRYFGYERENKGIEKNGKVTGG